MGTIKYVWNTVDTGRLKEKPPECSLCSQPTFSLVDLYRNAAVDLYVHSYIIPHVPKQNSGLKKINCSNIRKILLYHDVLKAGESLPNCLKQYTHH